MAKLKSFMVNNRKEMMQIIIGILIFVLAVVGITSAYMKFMVSSDSETPINLTSCAKITLLDGESSINLSNTAPMSNNLGMSTTPYEFTMKNTCDESVNYRIYLAVLSNSSMNASNVHYAIKDESNNILGEGILNAPIIASNEFTSNEITEYSGTIGGSPTSIYVALNDILISQTEANYQLYLWVDENATNEVMAQTFSVAFMAKAIG